jgi:ABC-type transporter Mla maintaining outer membrane lipid asymmetry permease subunit MlaE
MKKLLILKTGNSLVKSIIWGLIILLLCTIPGNKINKVALLELRHIDKFLHFLMYFIFSLILYLDLRKYINSLKNKYFGYLYIFFISLVWGVIIELIQYYILSYREGSVADIIANIGGILTGIFFVLLTGKLLFKT